MDEYPRTAEQRDSEALKGGVDISKRRFIYATLMFVPYGIRRGLADRTVLYFRGFACKAASVVISGSIREGKGSSNDCFETKLRTSLDTIPSTLYDNFILYLVLCLSRS